MKRALGDDQNRLLEGMRSAPSQSGAELLGPEDVHVLGYENAVRGQLSEAFAAGAAFGGAGAAGVSDDGTIEQSTTGLAHVVVTMLRRQIEDGSGDVADRVSGAYREWRGERVERVVGDFATQAFSAGVTAAGADRQIAVGGHVGHGVLGLRGQRAGRRGQRERRVPHRPCLSTGPLGLPLSRGADERLTRTIPAIHSARSAVGR